MEEITRTNGGRSVCVSPAAKLYPENTPPLPHVSSDAVERVPRSAAEAENGNNEMFNGGVQAKATLVAARCTGFDS